MQLHTARECFGVHLHTHTRAQITASYHFQKEGKKHTLLLPNQISLERIVQRRVVADAWLHTPHTSHPYLIVPAHDRALFAVVLRASVECMVSEKAL